MLSQAITQIQTENHRQTRRMSVILINFLYLLSFAFLIHI